VINFVNAPYISRNTVYIFIYCRFEKVCSVNMRIIRKTTSFYRQMTQQLQYLDTRANSITNVRPLLLASRKTLKRLIFRRLLLPSDNDPSLFRQRLRPNPLALWLTVDISYLHRKRSKIQNKKSLTNFIHSRGWVRLLHFVDNIHINCGNLYYLHSIRLITELRALHLCVLKKLLLKQN